MIHPFFLATAVVSGGVLTAINISHTVTLGSLIVAALVVAAAGFFTIRTNVAKTWQNNYEAEKVRAEVAEQDAREQRELKHNCISERGALQLLLDHERKRPDLTELSEQMTLAAAQLARHNTEVILVLQEIKSALESHS